MNYFDRTQYELLKDEELCQNERLDDKVSALKLNETHNLDVFFSQIYKYHQAGGFWVILISYILTAVKFVFLFFCIIELTVCVKWDKLFDHTIPISTWSNITCPPNVCWTNLPPLASICLLVSIVFFIVYLVRSCIYLTQFWGVKRFCNSALNMPTSDSDLADFTWSELLRRLLAVQYQMKISPIKSNLDELDIYNRILRRTNYIIGMFNREIIPIRFQLPTFTSDSLQYIYLPDFYLLNLKFLLFWGPKCPFITYFQLRPEYKWFNKREALAAEFALYSRITGIIGLIFSPFVLLIQLLIFMCSNAERLRYEPASFFGRRWSNFAHYYLRHFNELHHEFVMRLNQAHLPATQYLECFPSRLLNVVAENVSFTIGGLSLLLFAASLFREQLIHLSGYFAIMVVGGLFARVCFSILPNEQVVHFPRAKLIETLSRIHYMPDHWKEQAHTHTVRREFSQLFQFRIIGGIEELLSPILTPLILIFFLPKRSLDIVDFLRNFTVELQGVGDICSFAQLDTQRHGNPDWNPMGEEEYYQFNENSETTTEVNMQQEKRYPFSHWTGKLDVFDVSAPQGQYLPTCTAGETSPNQIPLIGGKTELSLMHFHFTNPGWNLPPDSLAYLKAVQKQALHEFQRYRNEQINILAGTRISTEPNEELGEDKPLNFETLTSDPLYRSLYAFSTTSVTEKQKNERNGVYSSDFSTHIKNVSHLPGSSIVLPNRLCLNSALTESNVYANNLEEYADSFHPSKSCKKTNLPSSSNKESGQLLSSESPNVRMQDRNLVSHQLTSSTFSQALASSRIFPNFGGLTPSVNMMGASSLYNTQAWQGPYQPYTSHMEDKIGFTYSLMSPNSGFNASSGLTSGVFGDMASDLDASSLYIHEIYHRRKQQRMNQNLTQSNIGSRSSHSCLQTHQPSTASTRENRDNNASASFNQIYNGNLDAHTDNIEVRFQSPGLSYLSRGNSSGRGRYHLHGTSVLRPGPDTRRQFEEVTEEEEDQDRHYHQSNFPTILSNLDIGRNTHSVSPSLTFPIPETDDEVPIWPNLPPPTC